MSSEVRGQRIHVADVTNRSPRPVRDVAWRIKPLAVQDYDWEAALVGELVPFPGALEGMLREVPGVAKIPLIRAGEKWSSCSPFPRQITGTPRSKSGSQMTPGFTGKSTTTCTWRS
jgi:hypothetical protein